MTAMLTCPRCGDLTETPAKWCHTCGFWLLARDRTSAEIRKGQQLAAALEGWDGEDTTPTREKGR